MRFKKTKPRVVEQCDYHSSTVCDFCGERKVENSYAGWRNDTTGNNATEVTLKAEVGDIWPEDDCRSLETFDCCPVCWEKKIKPGLQAMLIEGHSMRGSKHFGPYDDSSDYPVDPVE